jgi:rhamnosyltransferase
MRFAVIIPVLNASSWLKDLIPALEMQDRKPDRFLVIDSASTDDTVAVFEAFGAEVIGIQRSEFDHGLTRQKGLEHVGDVDLVIYLTQDAVPASPTAFSEILSNFEDETVGMAFGRQLPRRGAGAIESHARLFNYPDQSRRDNPQTVRERGIRAVFCSNSFSAYRVKALETVGGFPGNCIFGEDAIVAARLISSGWIKVYDADAKVFHSHSYNFAEDFRRNFDIGVMHSEYSSLWSSGEAPMGEGLKFVRSEFFYLLGHDPLAIPSAFIRTGLKFIAYSLGRRWNRLSSDTIQKLSMNKGYWRKLNAAKAA